MKDFNTPPSKQKAIALAFTIGVHIIAIGGLLYMGMSRPPEPPQPIKTVLIKPEDLKPVTREVTEFDETAHQNIDKQITQTAEPTPEPAPVLPSSPPQKTVEAPKIKEAPPPPPKPTKVEEKKVNAEKEKKAAQDAQLAKENAAREKALKDQKTAKDKALAEAKIAKDKAIKDAQAAKDKAARDAQAAKDKAAKDAQAKKDKAAKDAQAAKDKAAKDAQAAKDKAAKDAQAAKDKAAKDAQAAKDKAAEDAKASSAQKAAQEAATKKAEAKKIASTAKRDFENKIKRVWDTPTGSAGKTATARVTLTESGAVKSVIVNSSDPDMKASVEAAVRAAAPYPMPSDPDARREAQSFTSSFKSTN